MSLNCLTLAQLRDLAVTLTKLEDVGSQLATAGLEPVFDLTPGVHMMIQVPCVMPRTSIESRFPEDAAREFHKGLLSTVAASGPADAVADHQQPAPVEPPAVDPSWPAAGDPISSAGQSDRASVTDPLSLGSDVAASHCDAAAAPGPVVAESGGGQDMAIPESPPAPTPGSASALAVSHLAGNFASPPWTAEEDARLITLVVRGCTGLGLSRRQAIFAAAADLERPFQGAEFRCRSKLKDRLDAAIAEAEAAIPGLGDATPVEATQSPVSTAATAHQDADPAGGDAAVGGDTPAAVQTGDPLTAHLRGMTDKGGWSLARDLELMELSCEGWKPNEIALQLTMQANAIQPRFDALTGLHTDDATGKKQRRWTREEVLGALLVLSGKAAA